MEEDRNYLDKSKKRKSLTIVLTVILVVLIVGFIGYEVFITLQSRNISVVEDDFYISDMGDAFGSYYEGTVDNGSCTGKIYLSKEQRDQLSNGDRVRLLVITNEASGLSVVTTNLNFRNSSRDCYRLYLRLREYRFEYLPGSGSSGSSGSLEYL